MSASIDDLDLVEAQAWKALVDAVPSYRAPFHVGTVATTGLDGSPEARTVVLRSADPGTRTLSFHTDRRSPKFAELSADPQLSWLLYDEPSRMQLRLQARAWLHTDDALASVHWQATSLNSRRAYAAAAAPGSPLETASDGLIVSTAEGRWSLEASEACRPHFVVVTTQVSRLEVLVLHHRGHRRAAFGYDAQGARSWAGWRTP
jgi:pyridoxine/pyridoxamine 5'-phosphate oxidase